MEYKVVNSQQLLHLARKNHGRLLNVTIRVSLGKQNGFSPRTTSPPPPPKEDPKSKGNGNSKTPFSHYGRNTRSDKKRIKRRRKRL